MTQKAGMKVKVLFPPIFVTFLSEKVKIQNLGKIHTQAQQDAVKKGHGPLHLGGRHTLYI